MWLVAICPDIFHRASAPSQLHRVSALVAWTIPASIFFTQHTSPSRCTTCCICCLCCAAADATWHPPRRPDIHPKVGATHLSTTWTYIACHWSFGAELSLPLAVSCGVNCVKVFCLCDLRVSIRSEASSFTGDVAPLPRKTALHGRLVDKWLILNDTPHVLYIQFTKFGEFGEILVTHLWT